MRTSEGTERPWGGLDLENKVSTNSCDERQGKEEERSGHPGVPILAFFSLACQLAGIVILLVSVVIVLSFTGIANVALAARAKGDRIRGSPLEIKRREKKASSSSTKRSRERGTKNKSKNTKNTFKIRQNPVKFGHNCMNSLPVRVISQPPQPASPPEPRRAPRNVQLATRNALEAENPTESPQDAHKTMPAGGSVTASMPANDLTSQPYVQCPLPGQQGAPLFTGKDATAFLRGLQQFAANYQFTAERRMTDLADYCEAGVAKYVGTLVEIAGEEAGTSGQDRHERHWETFRRLGLKKFQKDDAEQRRVSVTFLRDLTAGAALRDMAEAVEQYVYEFKEISAALLGKRRLTEYDRVVLFLQELPDGLVEKIYLKVSLDIDDPDTFAREGCFKEAVEAALAFNRTAADVAKIRALGAGTVGGQPEEG